MLHAVIMAGGSGTRFWPLSRQTLPKQCLALGTEEALIVETSRRLSSLIDDEQQCIVAGAGLRSQLHGLFPNWKDTQFIWEPCARNTAPCIGLAALILNHADPDAILAVLPSDHHIADHGAFIDALSIAADRAQEGELVTLGIKPDRPETGYGYIELAQSYGGNESYLPVKRFVEKPNRETAQSYLDGGRHLWNSGMFIFSAKRMLADLEKYQPQLFAGLQTLAKSLGTDEFDTALMETFPRLPGISIDYGVLEPCSDDPAGEPITVIPSDFGWNDVGSWEALRDYGQVDQDGNVVSGRILSVDTQDSILQSHGPAVAVIGMRDVVVVSTEDAVLVCPRDDVQRVKEIPQLARTLNWEDLC